MLVLLDLTELSRIPAPLLARRTNLSDIWSPSGLLRIERRRVPQIRQSNAHTCRHCLNAMPRREQSGHDWNATWAVMRAAVWVIAPKLMIEQFQHDTGRNGYPFCGGRSQLDIKVHHGGMSRIDSDMSQKFVDLTMVGNRQPHQPSRKHFIWQRLNCQGQSAKRHAPDFSSRRCAFV